MKIEARDHVVLTVRNVQATCDFYSRVLGMSAEIFEDAEKTFHFGQLHFGNQKINLHEAGTSSSPKRCTPHPAPAISASSPRHRR